MTVLDLFIYACKNDLQDKDIDIVINQFKDSSVQSSEELYDLDVPFCSDRLEWSTEDIFELFKV